jgi:hypothetical protein
VTREVVAPFASPVVSRPLTFWIWIDPNDRRVQRRIRESGSFGSAGAVDEEPPPPPFIPNPRCTGKLSPFALAVLHDYAVEHTLEQVRSRAFARCPSRLNAVFLLPAEAAARGYAERHPAQVARRVLVRAQTLGPYRWSRHDSRWIDLLRHGELESAEHEDAAHRYWSGQPLDRTACDRFKWDDAGDLIEEVLYLGELRLNRDDIASVPSRCPSPA